MSLRVEEFDYELPERLIAQVPAEPRDASRLLVVERETGRLSHAVFRDLPRYLRPEDVLVINETRVLPARLIGEKEGSGGRAEFLLLRRLTLDRWEVLVRPGRRLRPGARVLFGDGRLRASVEEVTPAGGRIVRFQWEGTFEAVLDALGEMPLPPYIRTRGVDPERYQTVYSRVRGSAAAPTAGLHFTQELLAEIRSLGVRVAPLTLHVGLGTFRPVSAERVEDHEMHEEYYSLPPETVEAVQAARARGGRVVAVGTTVVRALESAAGEDGSLTARDGWTKIFIYPGYRFRSVDALVTNFHLPRSTLLMLVCAFAGRELTMRAYRTAVEEEYRFFSFGDAMFIA